MLLVIGERGQPDNGVGRSTPQANCCIVHSTEVASQTKCRSLSLVKITGSSRHSLSCCTSWKGEGAGGDQEEGDPFFCADCSAATSRSMTRQADPMPKPTPLQLAQREPRGVRIYKGMGPKKGFKVDTSDRLCRL